MAEVMSATPTKPKFNYSLKPDFEYMWLAALGLALEGCAGESGRFVPAPSYANADLNMYLGRVICLVIALIVILFARKLTNGYVFRNRGWAVAVCTLFSVGLALFYQERLFVTALPFLGVAGQILATCAGYAYLLIWFDRMCGFGIRDTLLTVGASLILRGGFQIILLFMQETPSAAFLVLLPMMSLPFLLKVFMATEPLDPTVSNPRNLPYRLVSAESGSTVAVVAFFAIMLLLSTIAHSTPATLPALTESTLIWQQIACVSANVFTGLLLFLTAGYPFSRNFLSAFLLGVAALMFIGMFLSTSSGQSGSILGLLMLSSARKCLDFLVLFAAFVFANKGEAQYYRHVLARFFSGLGSFISYILLSQISTESDMYGLVFGVLTALFFASLIIFFTATQNVIVPASEEGPQPEAERIRHPFRDALDKIASDAQLTSTEATILNLIARGHNAESVRQELIISVNTAKTHIRNIYAKLNIHSQQELIALVNETKAQIIEEYRKGE